MKKLLTFMIMLGLFAMSSITTEAALTALTTWDYAFVYDVTDGEFQFKDGTNTYTPEFTRTADGIYFNYTYTGDAGGLLPFEVTLIFNRSNTSWTLGTTGYIATDTKIGSDALVGNIINKWDLTFNNLSNNDFYISNDFSDQSADMLYQLSYNGNFIVNSFSPNTMYYLSNNLYNRFFIPSYVSVRYNAIASSAARYLTKFYLIDLGTSAAVQSITAYDSGYNDGFGDGYLTGVAEDNAYAIGYSKGLVDGGDMETGSSILIFVVAAIGFIMMIFGFTTKRGIFNLLSVGAFVVLGAMLAQYIGFIIIAIGLVLINVYYAFWGDL